MVERLEKDNKVERKEGPRRIFLEIGPGRMPVPSAGYRKFVGNDHYVGLDIDLGHLVQGRHSIENQRVIRDGIGHGQNMSFLAADSCKLPFEAESTDDVFLANVLESPSGLKVGPRILKEARRILKAGGKLIILGTNTPRPIKVMTSMLADADFSVHKITVPTDSDWLERCLQYSNSPWVTNPGKYVHPYLIEAAKKYNKTMTERKKGPMGPDRPEDTPEAVGPEFAEFFPGVDPNALSKEDLEIWRKLIKQRRIDRKEMNNWRTEVTNECGGHHDHPRIRYLLSMSSYLESLPSAPNIYFLREKKREEK